MARIAGVDLPRNKQARIALTYIFGIGNPRALKILGKANVDAFKKDGHTDGQNVLKRRRNKGRARWTVADETDEGLRELDPSTGEVVGLEFWEASSRLPADFLRMLAPPQVEIAA